MSDIKKMMRKASPQIEKTAETDRGTPALMRTSKMILDEMNRFYEKGKLHKSSGAGMMGFEALMHWEELANEGFPQHIFDEVVGIFYSAYQDGYTGTGIKG